VPVFLREIEERVKKKQMHVMKTCSDPGLRRGFVPFMNGELTVSEARKVERHLASCAQCRETLIVLLELKQRWTDLPHRRIH